MWVALFTRAWIEISTAIIDKSFPEEVALFTRAWIEITWNKFCKG